MTLGHSASNVGHGDVGTCAAWHFTYEDENRVFAELGMYGQGTMTITGGGEPKAIPVLSATTGVFRALGMNALLGRVVTPGDEDPDAPAIVLLSHGDWRTRFGEDREIVGKTLQADGVVREIVGVLPPTLRTLGQDPSIVVPLRFRRATLFVGNVGFRGIARLKSGVTLEQAEADMTRMLPLAFEKFPGGPVIEAAKQARYVPRATPLKDSLVGNVANLLWVLMAGAVVVLLIACANVANLVLVRAEGRSREMALRAAMGAGRGRLGWRVPQGKPAARRPWRPRRFRPGVLRRVRAGGDGTRAAAAHRRGFDRSNSPLLHRRGLARVEHLLRCVPVSPPRRARSLRVAQARRTRRGARTGW